MNDPAALPLFARIEASLRDRILRNELAAGSKLPSEAALEAEFGVSRITVRQALASLESSGLIRKVNGRGSFVTRPSDGPDLGPLTGFYEHMRAQGKAARGRLVSVRDIPATAIQAQALGVEAGTALRTVTLVRMVDGRPLAVGTTSGTPALMDALMREDLETNDVMVVLEDRLGVRLRNTHIEAGAVLAGAARARQLACAAGDPLLRIRFTPHDMEDRALCWSEMHFRGDAFSYRAVVKR
ncbi:GntR family transcriptional regulator [uncultured Pseudacidovorax sp.]|uniref:GntR family transcriptional regulator n=1 Tax=uncultured Pseudacidovorax sp. TaxID=679313 RepID=UPI0025EB6BD6|nr:GntR family transcriptional regulator [uncultured Pseudacidovorax sp.]